ncbi:MAG TPA: bifunctional nicotinamidase/pyrazinamidase [Alphaproteobacteria bacterium]|jgi:nicotinamidase/pyrazinamidase|nr:bifunctional nicotinamidase/pyrazinamidase [Alphaproteobacteria bacterium]
MTEIIKQAAGDLLLVVDVQNDFCEDGNLAVPDGSAVVAVFNRLAGRFASTVATQDWHPPGHRSFASAHAGQEPFSTMAFPYGEQTLWPDHCVQGTAGAEFPAALETDHFELVVRKGFRSDIDSYSAFAENDHTTRTGLEGYLHERGFKRLFLGGLAGDFCVLYSALDAAAAGFETYVIDDATRYIDLDGSKDAARQAMTEAGASIITSADLL